MDLTKFNQLTKEFGKILTEVEEKIELMKKTIETGMTSEEIKDKTKNLEDKWCKDEYAYMAQSYD